MVACVDMNKRPARTLRVYRFGANRTYLLVAAATLLSYALEGPLRYGLQLVSLESLLYVRDLFAVTVIAMAVGSWFAGQPTAAPLLAVIVVLILHTLMAVMSVPTPFQALFGLKIYLPFLLGFAVSPLLRSYTTGLLRLAGFVFLVTAVGVGINVFVRYPWIGADYVSAFATTAAATQWWASGGVLRLPGFTRASFTAASMMLVSLVPIMAGRTRWPVRLLGFATAVWVITLTTSKGALMALAAAALDAVLFYGVHAPGVANMILVGWALLCLSVPLITLQLSLGSQPVPEWLTSFMERIEDMWPRAFKLFEHPLQALWGRGIGGIGTAQNFGEATRANAADNLMVYLLVSFGVFGVLYVSLFLLKALQYVHAQDPANSLGRCVRGWTIIWLTYGLTANMIEEACINLTIGAVFGLAFGQLEPQRRRMGSLTARRAPLAYAPTSEVRALAFHPKGADDVATRDMPTGTEPAGLVEAEKNGARRAAP